MPAPSRAKMAEMRVSWRNGFISISARLVNDEGIS